MDSRCVHRTRIVVQCGVHSSILSLHIHAMALVPQDARHTRLDASHHLLLQVQEVRFVHPHELCHKGFQMKNGFASPLQAMLVLGCQICHFNLLLLVKRFDQCCRQSLDNHSRGDAVGNELVQTSTHLQQPWRGLFIQYSLGRLIDIPVDISD